MTERPLPAVRRNARPAIDTASRAGGAESPTR